MSSSRIRIGIVGAGANTRARHITGLRKIQGVEIVGVVNRTPRSTRLASQELTIPKTYDKWEQLVADPNIDAVVVGTWPYLHAPVTIAALDAGKHVLTEARMAASAAEAHAMLVAARRHPELTAMIVPSPFGFHADRTVKRLLADGYLGELREVVVLDTNDALLDPKRALHWRQVRRYSGVNMLTLGIMHETLIRWVPDPVRVTADAATFVRQRVDPETGRPAHVETPDSLRVLTELPGGARGTYHLSGVVPFGPQRQIHLYGTEGTLKYFMLPEDRLMGARRGAATLCEITVPDHEAYRWRVEEEFIAAIRGQEQVEFTDFATGMRYMAFTEAVARSAEERRTLELPTS